MGDQADSNLLFQLLTMDLFLLLKILPFDPAAFHSKHCFYGVKAWLPFAAEINFSRTDKILKIDGATFRSDCQTEAFLGESDALSDSLDFKL
ncbi:hypothetical protein BEP19_05945 [Ammoniphilus oxalaticus]|uniref:Uncharacterized protein n=1 Tax=Ammoniphilus oxalaticus TaxID=66863 RepID=A0A419SIW9_9BACL|nr:hypothetical protein BEP19_05945 [Ammoniphilus oxalaticus]